MIHDKTLTANNFFSKIKSLLFELRLWFSVSFVFLTVMNLSSCQSVSSGLSEDTKTILKNTVQQSCFQEHNAGFLINLSAPETPSVSWEGQWARDYATLDTQLLDPTGQVIQLASLSTLVDKFGSMGLRRIMCGYTAFSPKIILEGHQIVVKNKLQILQKEDQIIRFEARSEFYYGLFGIKKSPNTLYWLGRIEQGKSVPELIRFGTDTDSLQLDFIDYN